MCSCNRSRGYDELLERYQKLEQVSKEMCRWFSEFLDEWDEDFELGPDPRDHILHDRKYFRKKLEALGVKVDG